MRTKTPRKQGRKAKVVQDQLLDERPLDSIWPSPENDRIYRPVDPEDPAIQSLAKSIREHGVKEPLVVTLDDYILSGHRRHAAARVADLTTVPVRVEPIRRADDIDAFVVSLREFNRQRVKGFDEQLREEIISADPIEAHRDLTEYRQQSSRVDVDLMTLHSRKHRKQISDARRPLLEAVLQVLDERRKFWPLSVRAVHYAVCNIRPLKHASKRRSRYENDLKSYKVLVDLLARARLVGSVPFMAISDETRPVTTWNVHGDPSPFIRTQVEDFLKGYYRDLQKSQPNHIEIVGEKNTIGPILSPVAMEYTIPLTIGRGFCSIPPRYEMAQRFERSGKEQLVVLFLSDFDPDGIVIAESFARSMRDDFDIENIVPVRVGLTREQIDAMDDPPTALDPKTTSPNYRAFVKEHGEDCWELEAIPPADLQQILRESIDSVLDVKAFNAEVDAEKTDAAKLDGVRKTVHSALESLNLGTQ